MPIPKSWTKVTAFSKFLAMFLLITLPFAGFYLGIQYQSTLQPLPYQPIIVVPKPTPTAAVIDSLTCQTDSDCAWAGACNLNCLNKQWARQHPAPKGRMMCPMIAIEGRCGCLDNKCSLINL